MGLVLKIENETSLPDGGPLSVSVQGMRGIDIGRDRHLDWTLPDSSRAISGKHCEIRYQDGGYVLFDVSTNGTFLDGKEGRLKGPYRLRNGDRLIVGHYIIGVTIDNVAADAPAAREVQPTAYNDLWSDSGDAAAPVDRALLRTPRERPRPQRADFLDWAADVPDAAPPMPDRASEAPAAASAADDFSWANGPARPVPTPEPTPPRPEPRRPERNLIEADLSTPASAPRASEQRGAMPRTAPEPRADQVARTSSAAGSDDLRSGLAKGAGIQEQALSHKTPQELAEELGLLTRLVAENMRQLLKARLQAKGIARSSQQTTVQALDNNPLKFAATTQEALEVMLGPQSKSYLDARRAFEQGFNDIKSHQLRTFAAMQQALAMLANDLDPNSIDKSVEQDGAITKLVGSRKAKLWDAYVNRWQSNTSRFDGGLLDAFMEYFAQCYDRNDGL